MTKPDYRALCAELVELSAPVDSIPKLAERLQKLNELAVRVRALLAQPEQVAPTVMEIIELHTWLEDEWRANNDGEDLPMVDYARAVLAKWGNQ